MPVSQGKCHYASDRPSHGTKSALASKLYTPLPCCLLYTATAQQRLKAVDESSLAPVQTMLGEVIGSLRGVQLPDFSGLAHKLVEMEKQVGALPVKIDSGVPDIKNRVKPTADVAVSEDAERSWWDRTGEAVWASSRTSW